MKRPEKVCWMPTNEPSFILPSQDAFQRATAIQAIKGQFIDSEIYFSLLADRVQDLINRADDPEYAMLYIYQLLEPMNLVDERPSEIETAGDVLVYQNDYLRERLYLAGVFETLPKQLDENNTQAEEMLNETNWESWLNALTTTPREEYG